VSGHEARPERSADAKARSAAESARSPLPGPPEFAAARAASTGEPAGSSAKGAGAAPASPGTAGPLAAALAELVRGRTLAESAAASAFEAIADGRASEPEIGALLALLATRVPTAEELAGAVRVMRSRVRSIPTSVPAHEILDTAGTGGAPKRFNASTAAAIVAASLGAKVAKHGNRSRTGRGSAEVLAALGVNVDADPAAQARSIDRCGICFAFAIHHHPAAKHALAARRALPIPTIFNLVGPLVNPAGAMRQVVGVYHASLLRPMAEALVRLGSRRALVLHSDDGLDEVSISAPTRIFEVEQGRIREWSADPAALVPASADEAPIEAPASLEQAAALLRAVLRGEERGWARRMALANSAAALLAADRVRSLEEGVAAASGAIDFGDAWRTLEALVEHSGGRLVGGDR